MKMTGVRLLEGRQNHTVAIIIVFTGGTAGIAERVGMNIYLSVLVE